MNGGPIVGRRVVAVSSLVFDGREGTADERHVALVDLDSRDAMDNPREFVCDLEDVMARYGVSAAYLIGTGNGLHVVTAAMMTRRETERFSEKLRRWGSDSIHETISYKRGEVILRVSRKALEPPGFPVFVRSVRVQLRDPLPWSYRHWYFFATLHDHRLPMPGGPVVHTEMLRLVSYEPKLKGKTHENKSDHIDAGRICSHRRSPEIADF